MSANVKNYRLLYLERYKASAPSHKQLAEFIRGVYHHRSPADVTLDDLLEDVWGRNKIAEGRLDMDVILDDYATSVGNQ